VKDLEPVTHAFIPDTQAKEGVPTDHLDWIGNYLVEQFHDKPLKIIHAGDHGDMPSLSSYDKGKKAMEGRRYKADIEAAKKAWRILNSPLDDYKKFQQRNHKKIWEPEKYITLGNHEDRINRAIESDAQLEGVISIDDLNYRESGWTTLPFKEVLWLDGVAYSHFFYNPMTGTPYTGTAENRLKNIGHSFTMGHQQTLMHAIRFVGGKAQHGLVAGACYLHNEDYKGPQGNAHWRGIIIKHEVKDGAYDPMFVSLNYLCRRYEGMSLERFMSKKYPNL